MKALGLDLGDKTLGVAISDQNQSLARPLTTIRFTREDFTEALHQLESLLQAEHIDTIVLGLPKTLRGEIGAQGEKVLTFETELKKITKIKIVLWDERLTTKIAHQSMLTSQVSRKKRKRNIDQEAATFILQGYLDCLS